MAPEMLRGIRRERDPVHEAPHRSDTVGLVIAESYPLLLEGMRLALASEPGFRVLAGCTSGEEAMQAVRHHHADVLLIDLDISGNAMTTISAVATALPDTRVVLLASHLDETAAVEAMRRGVKGIVLKYMSGRQVIQCIRKVHRGGTWLEKTSTARVVARLLQHEEGLRGAAAVLSPRELDVVRLVYAGRTNKEIAEKLFVAEGTVKAHLHRIYEKLDLKGRLALALYAREKGLSPSL